MTFFNRKPIDHFRDGKFDLSRLSENPPRRSFCIDCEKRVIAWGKAEARRKHQEWMASPEYLSQVREMSLYHSRLRMVRVRRATPEWADKAAIAAVFAGCRRISAETGEPHHVDHIIPLAGEAVSGLHVHWNLRVIPARENIRKGAKMPDVDILAE